MATIYYTCNLLPLHIVTGAGHSARWLGNCLRDTAAPARREALDIHPMTCPYVTELVAAADTLLASGPAEDGVVVPGGCDAMRRLGDLLAAAYPSRVFVLSLSRSSEEGAVAALTGELARLDEWLDARAAAGAPQKSAREDGPPVDYPAPIHTGGVFVVAGPLSDNSLLRLIRQLGAEIAGLESCTSPDRWTSLAALPAGPGDTAGGGAHTEEGRTRLATAMLRAGVCPRRSLRDRREYLLRRLEEAQPSCVIYARQSFCDPGAYDALEVARLAKERNLPFLEIEVGFPLEASGPLRTRVEAFLEAQLLDGDLLDAAFLDESDDDLLDDDLDDDLHNDLDDPEIEVLIREEG